MSNSEVFVPKSGNLQFAGTIPVGSAPAYAPPRTCRTSERPGTNSSRFGRMSHNSFFVRHAPHPQKVRHIKGLLDIPICAVNDVGFYKTRVKDGLQFPPDNFNQKKIDYFSRYHHIPANAINVNTQMYPINTITGLQYFLGKPMNMRIYREKFKPHLGMDEAPEVWRDELRALMQGAGVCDPAGQQQNAQGLAPQPPMMPQSPAREAREALTGRPQTKSKYSEATGRLIPPPSRAMSRGFSRQGLNRGQFIGQMQSDLNLDATFESEAMVMSILCQILQTDDLTAVQNWLVNAGEQEKTLVTDMLKAAMGSKEVYYERENQQHYPVAPPPREPEPQGVIGDPSSAHRIDRLSLDGDAPQRKLTSLPEDQGVTTYRYNPKPHHLPPLQEQGNEDIERPVTTDPFRPSSKRQSRMATPKMEPTISEAEPKLKYTSGELPTGETDCANE